MKKLLWIVFGLFCFIPIVNAEDTYEAQIGNTKYATVSDAIAVSNNEEIVLLTNIGSVTIPNNKTITLNLNGKTINNITNSGNLTIKGNGAISYNLYYDGITNKENAVLVIDGLSFLSDGSYKNAIVNSGTLTIKNMNCGSSDNIISQCIRNTSTGSATVDGGSFYADSLFSNNGNLIINDGTFVGNESQNGSSLTINGGNFTSTSESDSIITNTRGKVVINGGTFTGYRVAVNYDPNYLWNSEKVPTTIIVTGGNFNVVGTVFENASLSNYSTITITGGNVVTQGKIIDSLGEDNNEVYINGGTLTYNGVDNGKAINMYSGRLIVGSNDGNVLTTKPLINLNGGVISVTDSSILGFYDGKFILKSKLTEKVIIPEGYYIKYDSNEDSTYTAYLAQLKSEQPVVPEEPKEDKPVVDDIEKEETNAETTVENPSTGLYLSFGIIGISLIIGLLLFIIKRRNYFNKI